MKKTRTFVYFSILLNSAFCSMLATCFVIYAFNNIPHISINWQMQMVAPVIWRIGKKKKERKRTVKLQTYADSLCPQWP